jgi:GH25 family lysozyme M1 (1,4-beta-N-acetylmuramidase)
MPTITLADISEHQSNFDAPPYIAGGHTCVIVRAHNGNRPDKIWPARRDYVRRFKFDSVGYYQYLVESRDAAIQAREFCACVGPLRDNEYLILDLEEGGGNQTPRADAWFRVVDPVQGFPATLYASLYFCRDKLGGWGRWAGRPRWIAAYSSREPTDPHELWQNTDAAHFPGLAGGVDGNIFHGSGTDMARTMRRGSKVAKPPAPPPPPSDHPTGMRWFWPEMAPVGFDG